MLHRYENGTIPLPSEYLAGDRTVQEDCLALAGEVGSFLDPCRGDIDFHLALGRIWDTVRRANQYIDHSAPWDLHKKGERFRLSTVLYCTLECLRFISTILFPFLPRTAREILRQLGQPDAEDGMNLASLSEWGRLAPGTSVPKPEALFPRIDTRADPKPKMQPAPSSARKPLPKKLPEIPLDTFQTVELRSGTILEAERIPDTDKLLKLTVDLGEKRTLVAGIGRSFAPETLKGKQVVVVANLKPTRIRGVLSEGMVLAAGPENELALVTFSQPVPPGEKIK
jgi:methionyl-tRNA synthetase